MLEFGSRDDLWLGKRLENTRSIAARRATFLSENRTTVKKKKDMANDAKNVDLYGLGRVYEYLEVDGRIQVDECSY